VTVSVQPIALINPYITLAVIELTSFSGLAGREGAANTPNQPHACSHETDITSSQPGEDDTARIDHESQSDKKPSTTHMLLKKYGNLIALLTTLVIHIILFLNGGSNAAGHNNLTLSIGARNDGIAVNASHVGDVVSCFRMNQTFS
jgi:hypothetical protein